MADGPWDEEPSANIMLPGGVHEKTLSSCTIVNLYLGMGVF